MRSAPASPSATTPLMWSSRTRPTRHTTSEIAMSTSAVERFCIPMSTHVPVIQNITGRKPRLKSLHHGLLAREQHGEVGQERKARDLGGLEAERPHAQPARRAARDDADDGHEREQHPRGDEHDLAHARPLVVVHEREEDARRARHAEAEDVEQQQPVDVAAALGLGQERDGAVDGHRAHRGEQEHRPRDVAVGAGEKTGEHGGRWVPLRPCGTPPPVSGEDRCGGRSGRSSRRGAVRGPARGA